MTGVWSEPDRQGLSMHVNAEPTTREGYISCFWALVRDARLVAKRDLDTGAPTYKEENRPQEAIWGASLLYMVLVDQIGTAFELDGRPAGSQSFRSALDLFGRGVMSLSAGEIDALYALRCSFAHDYSLVNATTRPGLAHLFVVTWSLDRPLVDIPNPAWSGDTVAALPSKRTIVNLKVLEELVEGMVVVIQDAARAGTLRPAHGMSVKQFTERYSFGITKG
jgi:hypothetical protein